MAKKGPESAIPTPFGQEVIAVINDAEILRNKASDRAFVATVHGHPAAVVLFPDQSAVVYMNPEDAQKKP